MGTRTRLSSKDSETVEGFLREDFEKNLDSRVEAVVKEKATELRDDIAHDLRRDFDREVEKRLQKALSELRIKTKRRLKKNFEADLPDRILEGLSILAEERISKSK